MRVGFIGLGNMGLPIARNLLKASHEVTVYNRTRSKAEELGPMGARVANSLTEASTNDVVMTMLADDHAVEQTTLGEGGVLNSLAQKGVHISLSTISTALSRRLTSAHTARGQAFVASPVFGRPDAADAARLVAVVAGEDQAVERARPLLEATTRKIFIVGAEPYQANAIKLAGNFLIASMLESLSEAFTLARKSGVEPARLLEIVNGSFFSITHLRKLRQNYRRGEVFAPRLCVTPGS